MPILSVEARHAVVPRYARLYIPLGIVVTAWEFLAANGETSGPLTVLTTQSAPPSTEIYDQTVPSDGYGYLTTRDGTKLSYSVHPPSDASNASCGAVISDSMRWPRSRLRENGGSRRDSRTRCTGSGKAMPFGIRT